MFVIEGILDYRKIRMNVYNIVLLELIFSFVVDNHSVVLSRQDILEKHTA